MALVPIDSAHALQIQAGTIGRKRGHAFEKELTQKINDFSLEDINSFIAAPIDWNNGEKCLCQGNPAVKILKFIAQHQQVHSLDGVAALWLGGLATSGKGDKVADDDGNPITRCKSDILLIMKSGGTVLKVGVSVKSCNKITPTNDQLYFTTASAFCNLLRDNDIDVTQRAEEAMKMFCGDKGFRPVDLVEDLSGRKSDPDRYFFEELPEVGKQDLISLFSDKQKEISLVLLKYAYANDPYPPSYLLHQTVKYEDFDQVNLAIFDIENLVEKSAEHLGFELREYKIRKGRFKDDPNIHLAPRFGFIQFQRGGQKQHPTQLQFNLKAGYFNHI